MPRPPRVEQRSDGSVSLRVTVGPETWALITAYAQRAECSEAQAVKALMMQIEDLIADDQLEWLGIVWQSTYRAVTSQHGARPSAGASDDEIKSLHRSLRTKSGFVGVYINGYGFKATGRSGEHLGTFKRAEDAALIRYRHYMKNGLPYGQLEEDIDALKRRGEQGSDEQLKAVVLETARHTNTLHLYDAKSIEEAHAAMKQYDNAVERRDQPKGRSLTKPKDPQP